MISCHMESLFELFLASTARNGEFLPSLTFGASGENCTTILKLRGDVNNLKDLLEARRSLVHYLYLTVYILRVLVGLRGLSSEVLRTVRGQYYLIALVNVLEYISIRMYVLNQICIVK